MWIEFTREMNRMRLLHELKVELALCIQKIVCPANELGTTCSLLDRLIERVADLSALSPCSPERFTLIVTGLGQLARLILEWQEFVDRYVLDRKHLDGLYVSKSQRHRVGK